MKKFIASIFTAAILSALPFHTQAASTKWTELGGGKARMVAVKDPVSDMISGLIEVKLDKDWKTYWKSPGGSGIPPEFDFSRSTKLTTKDVRFPTPEWIELSDAKFFGYKNSVSFTFEAEAFASDASLHLNMLIGVCEEICIPAMAELELTSDQLNTSDPKAGVLVEIAKAALPQQLPRTALHASLLQNEDGVVLKLKSSVDNPATTAVLELPSVWSSDPVEFSQQEDGFALAKFNLPDRLAKGFVQSDWQVNLIEMNAATRTVSGVTEIIGFSNAQ